MKQIEVVYMKHDEVVCMKHGEVVCMCYFCNFVVFVTRCGIPLTDTS